MNYWLGKNDKYAFGMLSLG